MVPSKRIFKEPRAKLEFWTYSTYLNNAAAAAICARILRILLFSCLSQIPYKIWFLLLAMLINSLQHNIAYNYLHPIANTITSNQSSSFRYFKNHSCKPVLLKSICISRLQNLRLGKLPKEYWY